MSGDHVTDDEMVCDLPPPERLRLATPIQDHPTGTEGASVERSEFRTEQDQNDLTALPLAYAGTV